MARVKAQKGVYLAPVVSEDGVMTWIRNVPAAAAEPALAAAYEQIYALYPPEYAVDVPAVTGPDGTSDSITAAHSLIPEALYHAFAAFGAMMSPTLPLSRRQHEMITTVVSVTNRCPY